MSLITQCPGCATLFKVVPDQLRVSDGWVRCGQCDQVFDANAHLQTTQQDARQSSFGEPYLPSASRQSRFVSEAPPSVPKNPIAAHAESVLPEPTNTPAPFEAPAVQEKVVSLPEPVPSELAPPDPPAARNAVDSTLESDDDTEAQTEAAVRAEYEALLVAAEAEFVANGQEQHEWVPDGKQSPRDEWADGIGESVFSFMQVAPPPAVVVRPWVQPTWLIFSVVLMLAFVFQVMASERDRIAAKAPAVKPFLLAMCDVFACKISAIREIESVVIDSSAFVKVRTDAYRVHLTLKNVAIHEVAKPALELTLTNAQDQPIARRVIFPREYGVGQEPMAPGAELLATVAISAKLSTDSAPISGYRLLVFYP